MNRGSTWPQQVLNLPVDAARNVFEFAYHPAAYIHPERVQQEVPEWLHGAGLSTRHASEGLLATLEMSPWNGLDWTSLQHRPALLPFEGLQALAWRLGLASMAPRLRRVVIRDEWQALSEFLSPADWQWVDQWPRPMGAGPATRSSLPSSTSLPAEPQPLNWLPADALDELPVSSWPPLVQQWGWCVVDAASGAMPPSIGARLRLKLPLLAPAFTPPASAVALTAVMAAYPGAVAQWNPTWDALWVSAPSTAQ